MINVTLIWGIPADSTRQLIIPIPSRFSVPDASKHKYLQRLFPEIDSQPHGVLDRRFRYWALLLALGFFDCVVKRRNTCWCHEISLRLQILAHVGEFASCWICVNGIERDGVVAYCCMCRHRNICKARRLEMRKEDHRIVDCVEGLEIAKDGWILYIGAYHPGFLESNRESSVCCNTASRIERHITTTRKR